jgi:uncharacterized membrane protein YtjA (UPF0391 family)
MRHHFVSAWTLQYEYCRAPIFLKENTMLRWALLFLIIALIAGALGLYPIAAIGSQLAWILFVVFLVLFLVSLISGGMRSGPPI